MVPSQWTGLFMPERPRLHTHKLACLESPPAKANMARKAISNSLELTDIVKG